MTEALIDRLGEDVTLRSRTLDTGSRDPTTEWPEVSFVESTIKAIVRPLESSTIIVGGVKTTIMRAEISTMVELFEGDEIIWDGDTYAISTPAIFFRKRGLTKLITHIMEMKS